MCRNYSQARVSDFIWHETDQRGCALNPLQEIFIDDWISFSDLTKSIPIFIDCDIQHYFHRDRLVNLLIETTFDPIESFGSLEV